MISHNYHPVQLFTYELQNKYIRKQNEAFEAQEKGEKTFDQVFCEEVRYCKVYAASRSKKRRSDLAQEKKYLLIRSRISS